MAVASLENKVQDLQGNYWLDPTPAQLAFV